MAFLRAPQADEEDEPQKIVSPKIYSEMSEQEFDLAYDDACYQAGGFWYEEEEEEDKPLARRLRIRRGLKRLARLDAMTTSTQVVRRVVHQRGAVAPRRTRRTARSSAKSGDSNSNDADPEPERPLFNESSLADLICISKKTIQNLYSKTPHLLPPAIHIPGARGPRWTPESVAEWLSSRPQHTTKTAPVAPRRKAGRPRIAHAAKGGASC